VTFLKVWAALIFGVAQLTGGAAVTGTVRLPSGRPAAAVPVVAIVAPGSGRSANDFLVLARLTQTDIDGRYRLEDIPAGRYFIAAGPVPSPTFYPGTSLQNEARVVTLTQDQPAVSGVDITLSPATYVNQPQPPRPQNPCCNLSGLLLTDNGSLLPPVPLRIVDAGRNLSVSAEDGFFRFFLRRGATAQLAVEGLPPGYSLKTTIYGGWNAGPTLLIDGREPQSLLLMIRVQPGSTLPSVTARGKVVNLARELNAASLSLVFTSTTSSGPTLVVPIQPDNSFEISSIPIGSYRADIRAAGSENLWASSTVAVIRKDVSNLTIDFADNPFPELEGVNLFRNVFEDGKEITITGVTTQRLMRFRTSKSLYFRMNVKDESTGVVTPWAVYVGNSDWAPNIAPDQTYTVKGTAARDGTNRLKAKPF
jgi:hypothetical protein